MSQDSLGKEPADDHADDLQSQVVHLEQELRSMRRRLSESPPGSRMLEDRVAQMQGRVASLTSQNERLAATLREARDQIVSLKEEIDRLAQPPAGFGVFLNRADDGAADVFTGGRKLRVRVSPSVDLEALRPGNELMLNEAKISS